MKTHRALLAGFAGALTMSAVMAAFRFAGVHTDLEAVLGSLVTSTPGNARWLTGFALHLMMGSCIAWGYAACFEFAIQRAGAVVGAGIGLSHGLLAGLCMSGIAEMNPFGNSVQASSGAFFQNIAPLVFAGPFLFLLLHALFGAVVGSIYGKTIQQAHTLSDVAH